MRRINFAEQVARKKLGNLPENFEFCGWELVGPDAVVYRGGVARKVTRGKNKGQLRWGKITHKVVVTESEENAARYDFEKNTGKCSRCGGDGQEWSGWNRNDGHRFKECTRCKAAGDAPDAPL